MTNLIPNLILLLVFQNNLTLIKFLLYCIVISANIYVLIITGLFGADLICSSLLSFSIADTFLFSILNAPICHSYYILYYLLFAQCLCSLFPTDSLLSFCHAFLFSNCHYKSFSSFIVTLDNMSHFL